MKNDLISRKAIKEYINQSDLTNREKMTLHIAINNIPTTAAAPEVHGRWVCVPEECDVGYDTYKCSICNEHFVVDFDFEKPKFCPVCGARMDGGEGE